MQAAKRMLELSSCFCAREKKNQFMPSFHGEESLPLTEG